MELHEQNEFFLIPLRDSEDQSQTEHAFSVGLSFFQHFDEACEFIDSEVEVRLVKTTNGDLSTITFHFDGVIVMPCDRCLEPLSCRIHLNNTLYVKRSVIEDESQEDEYWVVSPEKENIDVAQYIYDTVILSLPMQRMHNHEDGTSACLSTINERLVQSQPSAPLQGSLWEELNKIKDKLYTE